MSHVAEKVKSRKTPEDPQKLAEALAEFDAQFAVFKKRVDEYVLWYTNRPKRTPGESSTAQLVNEVTRVVDATFAVRKLGGLRDWNMLDANLARKAISVMQAIIKSLDAETKPTSEAQI